MIPMTSAVQTGSMPVVARQTGSALSSAIGMVIATATAMGIKLLSTITQAGEGATGTAMIASAAIIAAGVLPGRLPVTLATKMA